MTQQALTYNNRQVYALDVVDNRAVVGTKDRQVFVWDVRNMKGPMQKRESPLKVGIYFASKKLWCIIVSNESDTLLSFWRSIW